MTLDSLLGQETAAAILRNAMLRERVAHAYLFTGPEGVGKRTAALALARALNCEAPPGVGLSCESCPTCTRIAAGLHPDVRLVTPAAGLPPDASPELLDALGERAQITIGQIRGEQDKPFPSPPPLLHDAALRPHSARRRVFVVDPADRLNPFAANALLKLLEEPPEYVVLVLVTSRLAALLPTIISRCQQVQFRPAPREAVARLLEGRGADPKHAALLASLSDGRPGWAVTAWKRPETLQTRARMLDLVASLAAAEPRQALRLAATLKSLALESWAQESQAEVVGDEDEESEPGDRPRLSPDRVLRARLPLLLEIALAWYRDVLAAQAGAADLALNADRAPQVAEEARRLSPTRVEQAIAALEQAKTRLQRNASVDLTLEAMFVALLQ